MKRNIFASGVLILLALLIMGFGMSCEEPESHFMEGTWDFDIDSGTITGTMTLSFTFKSTILGTMKFYDGTATLNSVDYLAKGGEWIEMGAYTFTLYQTGEDPETEGVDFAGALSGSTISGTYGCSGEYVTGGLKEFGTGSTGTFTATK